MNTRKSILLIPLAALLLSGCASREGYKKPINDFEVASTIVIEKIRR